VDRVTPPHEHTIRVLDPDDGTDLALGLSLVDEYTRFSYEEAIEVGSVADLDLETLHAVIPDFTRFAERYSPPSGSFLVLAAGATVLGSVGVARYDPSTCEMNRLWLRDGNRGRGLGRTLVDAALTHARALGYRRMVLDVVPYRARAIALYRAFGFGDIAPIHDYPFDILAMGREL
jgi:carbonic anhydrase